MTADVDRISALAGPATADAAPPQRAASWRPPIWTWQIAPATLFLLVFLVGPPVTLDGSDPMLATLAEGMVLVTESSANLSEVHAYLDALSQQVPTRVYGTLAVPRV